MTTKTVDVREAQATLAKLVSEVAEGAQIILMEGDKPLARLVPISFATKPRVPGLHAGSVWTSDDFDEPLSEEFWAKASPADGTVGTPGSVG